MNYIKKLIIQLEDNDGNVWDNEIDGLLVTEIRVERPLERMNPLAYRSSGPDEITIKMIALGTTWSEVRVRNQRALKPKLERLESATKQLPEHEDESTRT